MSEETRITTNPPSKENRVTTDPPSAADMRISANCLPKEGFSKPILSPEPLDCLRPTWHALFLGFLGVVMVFLLLNFVQCASESAARRAYDRETQKKIDRFVKEAQRVK